MGSHRPRGGSADATSWGCSCRAARPGGVWSTILCTSWGLVVDPRTRRAGLALAAALVVSACTTPAAAPPPDVPSQTATPSATASTTPSPQPQATPKASPEQVWSAFHEQRFAQLKADGEPGPDAFTDVATPAGIEDAVALVAAGRSEVATGAAIHELWPSVTLKPEEARAEVTDCILVAPTPEEAARSQVWTGTLVDDGDGWKVDTVTPGVDDCVPAELQAAAIATYRDWLAGVNAWWDPPDPDHPRLEQVMVGDGLADMRAQLAEHQRQGIAIRDPHDPLHAVVGAVGIGSATVRDCHPADPEAAAFDVETGERLDISPPREPDQLDLMSVDLVRVDDTWKVQGWTSRVAADCTPGGTSYDVVPS